MVTRTADGESYGMVTFHISATIYGFSILMGFSDGAMKVIEIFLAFSRKAYEKPSTIFEFDRTSLCLDI